MLKTAFESVTNLFFPRLCFGCGSELFGEQQVLCMVCRDNLPETNFFMHANNPVEKIFWGRISLVSATSYLYFSKGSVLQHLMHNFKYRGKQDIGLYLGNLMGLQFNHSNRFNTIDALVPLPLHYRKEKKRGYNQAEILCSGISDITGVPVLKNVVSRPEVTETQTHKNRQSRWENIEGKFRLTNPELLSNKHVLLVDDVVTTGATLESCGHAILAAPGCRLSVATLAYTSL